MHKEYAGRRGAVALREDSTGWTIRGTSSRYTGTDGLPRGYYCRVKRCRCTRTICPDDCRERTVMWVYPPGCPPQLQTTAHAVGHCHRRGHHPLQVVGLFEKIARTYR